MLISSISQSGLEGVRRGLEALDRDAFEIARVRADGAFQDRLPANQETGVEPQPNESLPGSIIPVSETDRIAHGLVSQMEHAYQVQASLQVLKTDYELMGTVIDTFA